MMEQDGWKGRALCWVPDTRPVHSTDFASAAAAVFGSESAKLGIKDSGLGHLFCLSE